MSNNPFFLQPADYSQGMNQAAGLVDKFGAIRQQKQQQQQQQARRQELKDIVAGGDLTKVSDFMLANPDMASNVQRNMFAAIGMKNQDHKDKLGKATFGMLSDYEHAGETLGYAIEHGKQNGEDTTHYEQELAEYKQDPVAFKRSLEGLASSMFPDQYKSWHGAMTEDEADKTKMQQGTGTMSGFTFNPDTGEYTISDSVRDQLASSAEKISESKSALTFKDRRDINKDITPLLKDTIGINNAAFSLSKLKSSSSATDQLAAIFKFMKSLDPTSVVREGEQTMAVRTGGAADYLVSSVNKLRGGGVLTKDVFNNMVSTAKALSDSAVGTSRRELGKYLDVFGDKMPDKMRKMLMARVPESFNKEESDNTKQQGGSSTGSASHANLWGG